MRVAVDFDGTLVDSRATSPGLIDGDPVEGAIDALRSLGSMGIDVVVYSCRTSTMDGALAVRRWLDRHGLEWVDVSTAKPLATVYIDDRAQRFCGRWDETIRWLKIRRNVVPWNR